MGLGNPVHEIDLEYTSKDDGFSRAATEDLVFGDRQVQLMGRGNDFITKSHLLNMQEEVLVWYFPQGHTIRV